MPTSTVRPPATPDTPALGAARRRIAAVALALLLSLAALLGLAGCSLGDLSQPAGILNVGSPGASSSEDASVPVSASSSDPNAFLAAIPAYSGDPYVVLSGNEPGFTAADATTDAFERYSPLDGLGRCGQAFACLGPETLPTEGRGDISEVHPSGWRQAEYGFVDGGALYNRCHLIAHQLSGEDANERNLITGTRYLNTEGMLGFEEMVGDYIRQTGNHVLYRVTPVFSGTELVARGVQMEALSMEDGGAGVRFNIFAYNVQPGVEINYATGDSRLADGTALQSNTTDGQGEAASPEASDTDGARGDTAAQARDYVLNTNSMRFHDPSCPSVEEIAPDNRQDVHTTRDELLAQGYEPCGSCRP